MMATFDLGAIGKSFATRGSGAELRARLLSAASGVDHVEVDFAGVAHVSSSFADEFIGKLVSDQPELELITIGLSGDVKRVVESVIERRALAPAV
jgi:anti-anti-sigma regulatory factor